ncbi:MAG: 2-oxoglutarate dehydrogenase E1 component [Chloroflexi bacterium]|nr:2-oxoglutarate dehydrogenase E1 component [Chloroflexota bacterium]|tara:strand:- start:395 stop:2959 length:2565 start_codon:yes stop_codon:yes gene_type:complete
MLGPKHRKKFSLINSGILAEILEKYFNDPDSIDDSEIKIITSYFGIDLVNSSKSSTKTELDNDYVRDFGYLHADINPLKENENIISNVNVSSEIKSTYLDKIGWEFSHIRDKSEKKWLFDLTENTEVNISKDQKFQILKRLIEVENFEQFLHKSFVGARWYSLEGSESLIIVLDKIISESKNYDSINFGMPHRGRLNVLAHIFDKPYSEIFSEFREENINHMGSGKIDEYLRDVKYHLGAKKDQDSELLLFPNPSHLEMINPVILGATKAKQVIGNKSFGVLVHGDAAFPGEGINSESFNLSRLPHYNSNGSIHIVTNNQIGFTTNPENSFPNLFATDFVRGFDIPIIHINADDILSCLKGTQVAIDYKNKFNKDVVIDLISYRRYGHQEMDDPTITQPLMYEKISSHPTVTKIYSEELIKQKILNEDGISEIKSSHTKYMNDSNKPSESQETSIWPGEFTLEEIDYEKSSQAINIEELKKINSELYKINSNFNLNKRIKQIFDKRLKFDENLKLEWGHAEMLSLASLVKSNISVRLSGQDSQRGTFSQRNAIIWDNKGQGKKNLLENFSKKNIYSDIVNSPLSEMAALAFEFGYSIIENKSLIIWEAQFGDFVNNAQSVIDEFIVSSQPKWGLDSNLVLLLPHGYEGMGPNHSSGWIERFLESADNNNIAIANCSTSSQYFHLLRAHSLSTKQSNPLIIFTPKSLLRHPISSSSVKDISSSKFKSVIINRNIKDAKKIVIGSGKIIIDILNDDNYANLSSNTELLSLEMLYPFPKNSLKKIFNAHKNLEEIIWAQEEPKNRGAWNFIKDRITEILPNSIYIKYIGREPSAAPATGSASVHKIQQKRIIDSILK